MDKKQRAALYNQDTMRSELKVSNRNALCKSQIAEYTVQNRKNETKVFMICFKEA